MTHPVVSLGVNRISTVTPWRQQVAAQRHALAEFILAHADPEEALRVAHDTAADLGDAVKRKLIQRHGRTFDPLFDEQPVVSPIKVRSADSHEQQLLAAIAENPGATRQDLVRVLTGRKVVPGLGGFIPVLCRAMADAGKIEERGMGVSYDPFRYYPVGHAGS